MDEKTPLLTNIIIVGIAVFVIWGFITNKRENQEILIISAVEQACEQMALKTDCLSLGHKVVNIYEDLSTEDPRDFGE